MHSGEESYGPWASVGGSYASSSRAAPASELENIYSEYRGKRALDLVLASSLLLLSLPVIVVISLAVGLTSRGPVLYGHQRVGRDGQRFRCLKFRTMCADADVRLQQLLDSDPVARTEYGTSFKLRDDPRITRVGSILRRTSLDELPQLFNVIQGHMSLVGPRPVVEDELSLYGEFETAYLSARPGLTGAWQVNGRSDTSYAERVTLDVHYLGNQSPRRDASILLRTISVVARRVGAY